MSKTVDHVRVTQPFATAARAAHGLAVGATLVVSLLLASTFLPQLAGWTSLVVTSGSMAPALDPGDVVLVKPVDGASMEPMDIITFVTSDGTLVTHRIVDKGTDSDGTSFVTKGDANEEADGGTVDSRNVVGQVRYSVPHVGYLVAWARTPLGLAVLALGLAYVAFGGRVRRRAAAVEVPEEPVDDTAGELAAR